jgi:hypothetical protein
MRASMRAASALALASLIAFGQAPVVLGAREVPIAAASIANLGVVEPSGPTQVIVYDRVARTNTLVSHDNGAAKELASSSRPSISGDANWVAYETDGDVYLWDRSVDASQRLSIPVGGDKVNGASHAPSISGDGEIVAFASNATNLTNDPGQNDARSQVFAWQRTTGTISLVSTTGARAGNGSSARASVSADGRVIGFQSSATNLIAEDNNDAQDVFLRDITRGETIQASVNGGGLPVTNDSGRPSVSGDGGSVVFDSTSPLLVPRDTNNVRDVFIRDLPPAVIVQPNPLEFGVVALGTPLTQSVLVQSSGWTPVTMLSSTTSGPNVGDFLVAGDGCAGLVLPNGSTCTIAVLYIPADVGPRTATLEIVDNALGTPQLVTLTGGVPAATIRLSPEVGAPGMVTVVQGSGFPPGAIVSVQWDRGISQRLGPIVVQPDGSFSFGMLVFHHDRIGPRQLLVTAGPGGATFNDLQTPFLVVPAPLQPPGSAAIEFLAPDLQMILMGR